MEITIRLPDHLAETLQKNAEAHRLNLKDEILRELETLSYSYDGPSQAHIDDADLVKQLQAEGVLARDEEKIPPEWETLIEDVSEEEFEILRDKFSQGKPLSDTIIEDRALRCLHRRACH